MSRIRFATAAEVFEAFPTAADVIDERPSLETPVAYVQAQANGPKPENAVNFCAYMLPKREAVWWACKTLSAVARPAVAQDQACLDAAEAWVREPDDAKRRAALATAEPADVNSPYTWLAFAAGWSGGSVLAQGQTPPPPQHLTATCVRVAVVNALGALPARDRPRQMRSCISGALSLAGVEAGLAGR
jgi:hypothetical protein